MTTTYCHRFSTAGQGKFGHGLDAQGRRYASTLAGMAASSPPNAIYNPLPKWLKQYTNDIATSLSTEKGISAQEARLTTAVLFLRSRLRTINGYLELDIRSATDKLQAQLKSNDKKAEAHYQEVLSFMFRQPALAGESDESQESPGSPPEKPRTEDDAGCNKRHTRRYNGPKTLTWASGERTP